MALRGFKRFSWLVARRYWGWFVGIVVAMLFLMTVLTDYAIFPIYGKRPPQAMEIDGVAIWDPESETPMLIVSAVRTRFVDCSGGNLERLLRYDGKPDVPAIASYATTGPNQVPAPQNRTSMPVIASAETSPDVNPFMLKIPVKDPDDLRAIRWTLDATRDKCADGEQRIADPVGLIDVPPYLFSSRAATSPETRTRARPE